MQRQVSRVLRKSAHGEVAERLKAALCVREATPLPRVASLTSGNRDAAAGLRTLDPGGGDRTSARHSDTAASETARRTPCRATRTPDRDRPADGRSAAGVASGRCSSSVRNSRARSCVRRAPRPPARCTQERFGQAAIRRRGAHALTPVEMGRSLQPAPLHHGGRAGLRAPSPHVPPAWLQRRAHLPAHARPSAIERVASFPRNPGGKIMRHLMPHPGRAPMSVS